MTLRGIRLLALPVLLMILLQSGCEDKIDPLDPGGGELPDPATYGEHIQPLLDAYCTSCHTSSLAGPDRQGAPPGVNVDGYVNAVANAVRSNVRIQAGTMPPAGPLSTDEKALFQLWLDQGTQE